LRGYTGQALALLTGRSLALGYRHTERFLAELAKVRGGEALTQALTGWTASVWRPQQHLTDGLAPVFYIDGHRKPVYANALIPFNDRALNRDLELLCARVAEAQPHLPDGRRLVFRGQGLSFLSLDAQQPLVA